DAEYAACPICPSNAATDAVLMTTPRSSPTGSVLAMRSAPSRITLNVPTRFTLITLVNSASGKAPFLPTVLTALPMPAQFTTIRSVPSCSAASSAFDTCCSSVTSAAAKVTPSPSSSAIASPCDEGRSTMTTLAPAPCSSLTVASPSPDAPPVTSATALPTCIRPLLSSSASVGSDHRHERHATTWTAAQVVGERQVRVVQLPLARLATELQPAFVEHAQAAGADRMTERLQPAVGIDRQPPAELERAVEDVLPRLPALGEAHVLHEYQLGGREAVVHLGQRDLAAWIGHPGLLVGVLGAAHDLGERRVVVVRIGGAASRAGDQRQPLDVHRPVGVVVRVLGADDERGRRAVGHPGAVEHAQAARHLGRCLDLLLGHL